VKVLVCEQKCLHKDLTEDQTQNLPDESPVLVIALLGVMASGVGCNGENGGFRNGRDEDMTPELKVGSSGL
jgi:hypothetical protein